MPPLDIHSYASRRVAFRTIGCKLNQCETAQMQQSFLEQGFSLVDWDDAADVRVINTCTVTAKSDRTCRREIRLAKRLDPGCVVAVTGCYAEVYPQAVEAIPGVDLVMGNTAKQRLASRVAQVLKPPPQGGGAGGASPCGSGDDDGKVGADHTADDEFITHFYGYTRAFLKIQTGCDSRCAYCIIPVARGPARSMPRDKVLEQVRVLAGRDYKEVVLTGINLGSWTGPTPEERLQGLLRLLLQQTENVRFRLSSIEPLEVDPALLDTISAAGDRVAHHFHLPLQSGSDTLLRRMGRPYCAREYLDICKDIAARFPDAAIGADVIVGFPGESDQEFAETCRLIEQSPLTYLHVFSYSDRPGTAADAMTDKVHPDAIHERSVALREISRRLRGTFHERVSGTEQLALVLRERSPEGRLLGLTGNYVDVLLDGEDDLMNTFLRGTLAGPPAEGRFLLAEACPENRL